MAKAYTRPTIDKPTPEDLPALMELMREFAESYDPPERLHATPERMRAALFKDSPDVEAIIVRGDEGACGFALFWPCFHTWRGLPTLFIDSIYLRPEHRKGALAMDIYSYLCSLAESRGYCRVEGIIDTTDAVLRHVYKSMGAKSDDYTFFYMNLGAASPKQQINEQD